MMQSNTLKVIYTYNYFTINELNVCVSNMNVFTMTMPTGCKTLFNHQNNSLCLDYIFLGRTIT